MHGTHGFAGEGWFQGGSRTTGSRFLPPKGGNRNHLEDGSAKALPVPAQLPPGIAPVRLEPFDVEEVAE
jgi:hypothetical protein